MNGRTCLISGATDGIGKEAAIELAKKGCNLILIGRSKKKRGESCGTNKKSS